MTLEEIAKYTPWVEKGYSPHKYSCMFWYEETSKQFAFSFGGCIARGKTIIEAANKADESYNKWFLQIERY